MSLDKTMLTKANFSTYPQCASSPHSSPPARRLPVAGVPIWRPPFFEGGLHAVEGIPLRLEESILLHEGFVKRLDGRLLLLGPSRPRHERHHILAQRGYLQLSLLGLLLSGGPLRVTLTVDSASSCSSVRARASRVDTWAEA